MRYQVQWNYFRVVLLVMTGLPGYSGCSTRLVSPLPHSPYLIYDRQPSTFSPDAYAEREDHRRVRAEQVQNESLYHRLFLYDSQGTRYPYHDYYSRRTTTIRESRGTR